MSREVPDKLRWRKLSTLSWDEAAEIFTCCYEGYVIPVRATGADLAARCLAEDVDPSASYVIDDGSRPVAIGLIARRGKRARLAAFAVARRARGKGLARPFIGRLIGESEARGDAALELEVFEHNLPAVHLYSGSGFARVDRLVGFQLDPAAVRKGMPGLRMFPVAELAASLATDPESTLPWQLDTQTISRMGDPWRAMGDGDGAFALVDLSRNDAVALRLLFTPPALRRTGRARNLLAAILAGANGRPVRVPQLIPERYTAFAKSLGFAPAEHAQLRMVRPNPRQPAS